MDDTLRRVDVELFDHIIVASDGVSYIVSLECSARILSAQYRAVREVMEGKKSTLET